MSVYRILNYPVNYPDTTMAAGNCHAKYPLFEWMGGSSLTKGRTPSRSITCSLYVTVVESTVAQIKNQLDPLRCLATIHERYRQPD